MKLTTKRLLSLLLCFTLLLGTVAFLASCGGEEEPSESEGEENTSESTESTETEPTEYTLNLVENGKTEYVIIVPTESKYFTNDMLAAVKRLCEAFKNYTGATIEYKDDFLGWDENYEEIKPDPNAKEILIGHTNREESAEAVEGFGIGEYVIKADGTRLVINGDTPASALNAIEYFITVFLQGNEDLSFGSTDATFIFETADNYVKQNSYFIKSITLLGKSLTECQIVYPEGGTVEKYFGNLIRKHLSTYSGIAPEVVSDKTAKAGPAILIGNTNRTTSTPGDKGYAFEVTDAGMEITAKHMFAYLSMWTKAQNQVFSYDNVDLVFEKGYRVDGISAAPENIAKKGDVRIMYHNVWGYMNAAGNTPNPVANRYEIVIKVYETYQPDIIGFQEARTEFDTIGNYLKSQGYDYKAAFSGNPLWYNTNTLELLDHGSENADGHSYNTYWGIFRVKATGKVFAATNSHFTANSMVPGDTDALKAENGNLYRIEDAKALLRAVAAVKASAHGGENIPIFTGGDYNCNVTSTAYTTLTDGGLVNTREIATTSADISCHHNAYTYDDKLGYYLLPGQVTSAASSAIDYIMMAGKMDAATVHCYEVIGDRLTALTSDHAPHFIDVTLK